MTSAQSAETLHHHLIARLAAARTAGAGDPQQNPVLSVALALEADLSQGGLSGGLSLADSEALVQSLSCAALEGRADQLGRAYGEIDPAANAAALDSLFTAIAARGGFEAYAAIIGAEHQTLVFTAHPTFPLAPDLAQAIAELAAGTDAAGHPLDHAGVVARQGLLAGRAHLPPAGLTLEAEHRWAMAALSRALDGIDVARRAALTVAARIWPDRWHEMLPRLAGVASWVGFDTDGRTDIGWSQSLRFRLDLKRLGFARLRGGLADLLAGAAGPVRPVLELLAAQLDLAEIQVSELLERLDGAPDLSQAQMVAQRLVGGARTGLTHPERLDAALLRALALAEDDGLRAGLILLRASLAASGLGLGRVHTRVNATQLHNAIRNQIGLETDPEDPRHRRSYQAEINRLIGEVTPLSTNLGAVLGEGASAKRLMILLAQILKHVDSQAPIRFLIAECDSALTLLIALYYARLFGVAERVEICPLFETASALEHGATIIGEALKSPHFHDYVRQRGCLWVQFGYSDSGRYLGQMAATFAVERLRRRLGEGLARHGLSGIRIVLFDTHGESPGRGGHPVSYADRFRYLAPPVSRAELAARGFALTHESSFQGGDGFMPFMTAPGALAIVTRALEAALGEDGAERDDPVYADPDFAAEFFAATRQFFEGVVGDADYARLLGLFGTHMLPRTGSRPARRQSDDWSRPAELTHPSQLRAIPNNAVLLQLGCLANSLGGVGQAAGLDRETFLDLRGRSPRFRRAMALVEHALSLSDGDVLAAYVAGLDPGLWLTRAARAGDPERAAEFAIIAELLERRAIHPWLGRIGRRLRADQMRLEDALAGSAPLAGLGDSARTTLLLLHAMRIALIHYIYRMIPHVPDFSPRHDMTWDDLMARLLQLDVVGAVDLLRQIFPAQVDHGDGAAADFAEPSDYHPEAAPSYARAHEEIFAPLLQAHALIQRISTAIGQLAGAMG